jgi:hypothetical protein
VVIGSRDVERAHATARELQALDEVEVRGLANPAAAEVADVVVITVPYSGHRVILESIRAALSGKPVIDVTVRVDALAPHVVSLPVTGSAAAEAQALLGPGTPVVAAFQNVSAHLLHNSQASIECDVLVCSDDIEAKRTGMQLVAALGARAFDAGPLANAGVVEGLTSILIGINRRYGVHSAGIRITGLD